VVLWSCSLVVALGPPDASGYSVLTHEEIIDILWRDDLQPLLLEHYPTAASNDLLRAHAYAYGGSLVYDMGYLPFGNRFFTDLLHYVRTGDFVSNLIREAHDLNEYAFALGALSHYSADISGHPAVNRAVALSFPKLQGRYGPEVTYEDCPRAHTRTEFGFDLVQVAKRRYTSDQYHSFIGFEISKPVLERAFFRTYGLTLRSLLVNEDLAIGTLRRAVSKVIPEVTRVAIEWKMPDIDQVHETTNAEHRLFRYYLSQAEYQRQWGREYRHPTLSHRLLSFFLRCIPRVGPFKALAFNIPTTQTEDLYLKSINKTVENYRALLREAGRGGLRTPNADLDTGRKTRPSEYWLCDKTFAQLVHELYLQTTCPDHRPHHHGRPPHHTFIDDGYWTPRLASPKDADSSWPAPIKSSSLATPKQSQGGPAAPKPGEEGPALRSLGEGGASNLSSSESQVATHEFQISADIRETILAFYASGPIPTRTCYERRRWRQTQIELNLLKATPPAPESR